MVGLEVTAVQQFEDQHVRGYKRSKEKSALRSIHEVIYRLQSGKHQGNPCAVAELFSGHAFLQGAGLAMGSYTIGMAQSHGAVTAISSRAL